jgi:putative redox protein
MSKKNYVFATLGEQNYYTQVTNNKRVFYVDEPEEVGGSNQAPHPTAYLLGALTSCTAITIRMYAQRKGWDVGQIKVAAEKVESLTSQGKQTKIIKQITFGNELPEEQLKRLVAIGEKCPVSLLLKNETEMFSEVVDQLDEGDLKE